MSQEGEVSPPPPQVFGGKRGSSESPSDTGKNETIYDSQAFYKMCTPLCIKKDQKKKKIPSRTKGIMRATARKKICIYGNYSSVHSQTLSKDTQWSSESWFGLQHWDNLKHHSPICSPIIAIKNRKLPILQRISLRLSGELPSPRDLGLLLFPWFCLMIFPSSISLVLSHDISFFCILGSLSWYWPKGPLEYRAAEFRVAPFFLKKATKFPDISG